MPSLHLQLKGESPGEEFDHRVIYVRNDIEKERQDKPKNKTVDLAFYVFS